MNCSDVSSADLDMRDRFKMKDLLSSDCVDTGSVQMRTKVTDEDWKHLHLASKIAEAQADGDPGDESK